MSFEQFLTNPKIHVIKKYMAELLREEYAPNSEIIERLAGCLITEKDMKEFSSLVGAIYSVAYSKCVEDHKKQLQSLGIQTVIKEDISDPTNKIFK